MTAIVNPLPRNFKSPLKINSPEVSNDLPEDSFAFSTRNKARKISLRFKHGKDGLIGKDIEIVSEDGSDSGSDSCSHISELSDEESSKSLNSIKSNFSIDDFGSSLRKL